MAGVAVKFQPIERDLLFQAAADMQPEGRSKALAAFARGEILAAAGTNEAALGHPVPYDTFVDGTPSSDLDRVTPDGTIVAEFSLGTDLVQWIYDQLVANSPKRSGRYRASHLIYADGAEVATPDDTVGADEIVITAVVPYARKIERGLSKQAPDGVYQGVAAAAAKRFGNLAKIKFTYRAPVGGATSLETWAKKQASRVKVRKNQRRQYLKNVQQPSVVITFR